MANYFLKLNETFYLYLILSKRKKPIEIMISISNSCQGSDNCSVLHHCFTQENKGKVHPFEILNFWHFPYDHFI